jgi:hypothetical protein
LAVVVSPAFAGATVFHVTLTTSDGQFPGKQPAPFGNSAGPVDVNLTPDVAGSLLIDQFSGFLPNDVFPYEPGASTTIMQTLSVNDVVVIVNRTVTLLKSGDCQLVQALSPVTLTVDLGPEGKVTLTLATPPTLAVPCFNGQPSNPVVIVPGTFTPIAAAVLDDFVFYKVKGSKGAPKFAAFGPVELDDLLDFAAYDVTGIAALGLPASPNFAGTFDDTTHLASYRVKRRKSSGKFAKLADTQIHSACGDLLVTLVKPESLLVPVNDDPVTAPDPATSLVDHFVCYKTKPQKKRAFDGAPAPVLPKGVQIDAEDHFQTRRYDLEKITRVCLPVDKSGAPVLLKTGAPKPITPSPLRHPDGALVCYQAKIAKNTIAQNACGPFVPKDKGLKIVPSQPKHVQQLGVPITGQLGSATLDTAKELEICVPQSVALPLT